MKKALLDGNLLVALLVSDHVHHDASQQWFDGFDGIIVTTPTTQGTLLRLVVRSGASVTDALSVLTSLTALANHEFWPDDMQYSQQQLRNVTGHRQVTDSYLAAQARQHNGRLVTFDRGLSIIHPDVTDLLSPVT